MVDTTVHFSGSAVSAMIFVAALCFLLPLFYLAFLKFKKGCKISSFLIGAAFALLFSFFGESVFHMIFLAGFGLANLLADHPVYTAIYYAAIAAIAAQAGTWFGFKWGMKKYPDKQNAFVFGLGKGGFECILYGGIVYITNIVLALMVNSFGAEEYLQKIGVPAEQMSAQISTISDLAAIPSSTHMMDGTQRLLAMCLHTALSLLVYMAVHYRQHFSYLGIAAVLHMIGYLPIYLQQTGVFPNASAVTAISGIYTFLICVAAYRLYHTLPDQPSRQ